MLAHFVTYCLSFVVELQSIFENTAMVTISGLVRVDRVYLYSMLVQDYCFWPCVYSNFIGLQIMLRVYRPYHCLSMTILA